ncbi:MAG: hypothetical protein QF464_09225, partial [Myxococcota bacterium]|nr:hypothetical protein [Myxococcota bacterium]
LSLSESLAKTATPEVLAEVCRCVAVLGDNVRVDLLMPFLEALGLAVDIDAALDPLLDVGLLVEGPIGPYERVALEPALLRELLLGDTRPRKRRKLERLAADVRIRWAGAHADGEASAIGDHLEAAGEPQDAVPWWRRSMRFGVQSGAPSQSVRAGLKALQYLDHESEAHAEIAITTGRLLLDMGELADAASVLMPITRASHADHALRAGDVLADVYENAGQGAAWDSLIDAMSQREDEAGPTGLGALYCARSMWLNSRGQRERGFTEAQRAVETAQPGREAQRAAQRLVYTCLSRGDLALGEEVARKALEHAGADPELKARSLRALGVVLVWKQRGTDAIVCFEALLKLARRHGFIARLPIGWHDLGEAFRVNGQLVEARDAYGHALRTATEMQLTSSVELIQPKLIICDLLEGHTEGVLDTIARFVPSAMAAGLALAEPFGHMLSAWAYALDGDLSGAQGAYDAVADMRDMAIDPQFPRIMEEIGVAFSRSPSLETHEHHRQHAREALSLAAEFWMRYGQTDRSAHCDSLQATL